ncbi:SDR family NAD(P)-dependent oxidoreductase [Spirochaetota bacterium]
MKSVVITGSSKGIGLGLAKEFLKAGCSVALSSFEKEDLEAVYNTLAKEYGDDKVAQYKCDVTKIDEVEGLWKEAKDKFGTVDIWINNAGVTNAFLDLWEVDPAEVSTIVNTNLVGTFYGVRVAMHGMMEQGSGAIYNFYGFGAGDERKPAGLTTYGTTKRAIRYMTECLIEETKESPIQVGSLMPGTVITDFLYKVLRSTPKEGRDEMVRGFNMFGDTVETVTEFLAKEVLANTEHGAEISWMTPEKAQARMKDPFYQKRDLFSTLDL